MDIFNIGIEMDGIMSIRAAHDRALKTVRNERLDGSPMTKAFEVTGPLQLVALARRLVEKTDED